MARERFEEALKTSDPLAKDGHIRAAFCSLYRAADIASMLYTTRRRKGYREEGGLLTWSRTEFEIFIDVLHKKYYSLGAYPKDLVEPEFERWCTRVRDYVNKLDRGTKLEQSVIPANEWMTRRPEHGQMR